MAAIGKQIKQQLNERGMSNAEFARRINTHVRNVYDIFKRKSLDTDLLLKISNVLEYDFFQFYSISNESKNVVNESSEQYSLNAENKRLRKKVETLEKEIESLSARIKDKETIIKLLRKNKDA